VQFRHRTASALLASAALAGGVMVAPAPALATTGFSFAQLSGEPGDIIVGNRSYFLTPTDSFISAQLTASSAYVGVARRDSSHWFSVTIVAPQGEELVQGQTYTGAQDSQRVTPPHPMLSFSGDGVGCGDSTGSFTILEREKDAATGEIIRFAASFEVTCGGRTGGSRGTVAWNATRSPVVVASTTPATVVLDGPVTVSGTLQDAAGPFVGAAVTVTRPDGAGGAVTLPATSGLDGAFTVQDTIGVTARTWTVQFAGDATHGPVTRTVTVSPVKAAAVLALTTPTAVVKRGATYSVHGTLTSGGVAVAGATVTLKRTNLAGTRTVYARTTAYGSYTVSEAAAVGGPVTWRASWPGTSRYATPTPVSHTVTVDRVPTSISITPDRSRYAYGARATLTVRLGTTYNSRVVSVFAHKATTGRTSFIARGSVDRAGKLVLSVPVTSNTQYSVKFIGDYRFRPAAAWRSVVVGSKLAVTVPTAVGRSGPTYILGTGDSYNVVADILPEREGACVRFVVQRSSGSGWVTTRTLNCVPVGYPSRALAIVYRVETPGTGRIKVLVPSDVLGEAIQSSWVYFRFS
jgi:hypothetical protein